MSKTFRISSLLKSGLLGVLTLENVIALSAGFCNL